MLMRETHARRATDQYACRHVGTSVYVVYVSQYTEPESAYSESRSDDRLLVVPARSRTLRGARYDRSLLLTCTPGPARGYTQICEREYVGAPVHVTCPASSDETGRNWTKNMPPVQSQASCVGARAIVWIAETLLLATEGFVDVPSSFVQFRPVSSSRRLRSALPAPDFVNFVSDAAEGAPVLCALPPRDDGRCAGDGAEDVEDGLHT